MSSTIDLLTQRLQVHEKNGMDAAPSSVLKASSVRDIGPGMRGLMHFHQMCVPDSRVSLCCGKRRVSQQFLDTTEISAPLKKMCCKAMACYGEWLSHPTQAEHANAGLGVVQRQDLNAPPRTPTNKGLCGTGA